MWIPYHDVVDGTNPIYFKKPSQSKDPNKEALVLSWKSRQALLDCATFRKWDGDSIPQAKTRNINTRLIRNGYPEESNTLRRHFKEGLRDFHPRAHVQKSKMQPCP